MKQKGRFVKTIRALRLLCGCAIIRKGKLRIHRFDHDAGSDSVAVWCPVCGEGTKVRRNQVRPA